MKPILLALLIPAAVHAEASRDPWLRPFDSRSIWNMPIGSEAEYVPGGLTPAAGFSIDEEILLRVAADAPERPLFAPASWEKRAGGTLHLPPVRINDQYTVPDARQYWTPNFCAALLMPDNRTLRHLGPLCRPEPGGPVFAYTFGESDLHGDGILGSHGGSRLSALGGSIRLGELTGEEPVRHALKFVIDCGKFCHFDETNKGYRWPAATADSYAAERYKGTNKALLMGSLLALRPELSVGTLALKTPVGKKLFHALQDYGAYIVDDSAHDYFYLAGERGVQEEMESKLGHKFDSSWSDLDSDIRALLPLLHVVANNAPDRIGGGGTPRQPLAPPLADRPAGEAPPNIPAAQVLKIALNNPMMSEGEARPAAWTSDWGIEGKASVTRDTQTYHSAPASLCISSLGENVQGHVAQTFDATAGERLRVSGWLRADGGANAMLGVQSYTREWQGISLQILGNSISGMDWREVSGEVTLPPHTAHAAVQLIINGPGKAWLDDVSADGSAPGNSAEPKSEAMIPPPAPAKARDSSDPAEGFWPDYPMAWRQRAQEQIERSKQGNTPLVFIGDSLTEGWSRQPRWAEHYSKMGAANYGIGGDGTPQVLWRIRQGLLDGSQPEVIVLCIGVNNIWPGFGAADTLKGIESIVAMIRGKCPETRILLIGNTHLYDDPHFRERVRFINSGQAKLADGKHIRFVDFSEKMLQENGTLIAEFYEGDKLHLSPAGYNLWSLEMDAILADMLN